MSNADRAASVSALIATFAANNGLTDEDPCTIAGDMICNILHWVTDAVDGRGQVGALEALRSGASHYVAEQTIAMDDLDELGPDAYTDISVECGGRIWSSSTASTPTIE